MRAPQQGESRWDSKLDALVAALDHRLAEMLSFGGKRSLSSPERVALTNREMEALVHLDDDRNGLQLAALAFADGGAAVRIAVLAPSSRAPHQIEASLELLARSVLGEAGLASARASLDFWRVHGSDNGRQAAGARRELRRERAASGNLDDAIASAMRARPSERFARWGELIASAGGFDQWIVAVADGASLVAVASSSARRPAAIEEKGSALAESFRKKAVISCGQGRDPLVAEGSRRFHEDKYFNGSFVCVPFEIGAIALGSRTGNASLEKAQAMLKRLAPLARTWTLEREASSRANLVRRLAFRMFAAVDEERVRIARDLHDDQAQLLTVAKIALEGRRDQARSILLTLEQELRSKTRELRPATLGALSLHDAVEREFDRLGRAGISSSLVDAGVSQKLSRPVQQLCFQVVREALSNVIKHARAKSVQVKIERNERGARIVITDDGRGIGVGGSHGVGLIGARERLELLGGKLAIESRVGRTTVIAEIPEPA